MLWYAASKKRFMSVIFLNMKINAASIRVFFPNGPTEKNNFQKVECSRRIAQKNEKMPKPNFGPGHPLASYTTQPRGV